MTELNPSIAAIPMPERIKALPIGPNGYPVPFFVAWPDGKPEFRCADPRKLVRAVRENLCWVCGERVGQRKPKAFVIGPMCSVNRTSAEPPSHRDCALYSVRACPFLSRPHMDRRENAMPGGAVSPPGHMIRRNPGAIAIWTTGRYELFRDDEGGVLFRIGEPTAVTWWAEGRPATRAEVEASIESGIPLLMPLAESQGPSAVRELARLVDRARAYLPVP